MDDKLEAGLEQLALLWTVDHGGLCLKVKLENQRGFPDRMIILPGGFVCFVEFKRPDKKGKPSPHQTKWIKHFNKLGQKAFFCDDFDQFVEQMREWGQV